MHLSVYEQGEVFYFSFVFGLFVGLYYDVYRFLRYIGFTSKSAVMIQDLCFMCTSAVATFLFSQTVVNGHIRVYVLAAEIFGAVSYRYSLGLLSSFIFKILQSVLNFIKKVFGKAASSFSAKFNAAASKSANLCGKIVVFVSDKAKNIKKVDTN